MYRNSDIDYLKFLKKREVIIFGAGESGKQGFVKLKKENIKVTNICDNDKSKQGNLIYKIEIISFEELRKINNSNIMIVICSNYENEIKEQLLENKIYNSISISQIDFGSGGEYYDETYFKWQENMGKFGGKLSAKTFQPYIKDDMICVEFGSGGGYLLENIRAKGKIGIEINDTAREAAKRIGINSVKNISDIPDKYADIIISTHVLEHVENPFGALSELRKKLKDNGRIIFIVPNESCDTEYYKSDVNNHLYTWNCLNLGNLFKAAGFFVQSVEKVQRVWTKHYVEIEKEVSEYLFDSICEIGGEVFDKNNCMIIARK